MTAFHWSLTQFMSLQLDYGHLHNGFALVVDAVPAFSISLWPFKPCPDGKRRLLFQSHCGNLFAAPAQRGYATLVHGPALGPTASHCSVDAPIAKNKGHAKSNTKKYKGKHKQKQRQTQATTKATTSKSKGKTLRDTKASRH